MTGGICVARADHRSGGLTSLAVGTRSAGRTQQFVEAAEGGEDGLLGAAVAPVVFDELQVGARAGLFGAEEHGGLRSETLGG